MSNDPRGREQREVDVPEATSAVEVADRQTWVLGRLLLAPSYLSLGSLALLFLSGDPMSEVADVFRMGMIAFGMCGYPATLVAGIALLSNPRLRMSSDVRVALGGAVLYQIGLIGIFFAMLAYAPFAAGW